MFLSSSEPIEVKRPPRLKFWLTSFIVAFLIVGSAVFAEFSVIEVLINFYKGSRLLDRMFLPPAWDYTPNIIGPLLETIQMAIVGSFLGAIVAFPVALMASSNFIRTKWVNTPVRVILNVFRTIPALVLASLFVAVFSSGAFAGVAALFIFSFGLISKLTYETVETIDDGPIEAMMSLGANRMEILRYAIIPQIMPQFMSYALYAFEVNVRAAAVLGYVGAGGVGQIYEVALSWRRFDRVGMIVIISFGAVLIIDLVSSALRRRLV